jgi:hypothetical protein
MIAVSIIAGLGFIISLRVKPKAKKEEALSELK